MYLKKFYFEYFKTDSIFVYGKKKTTMFQKIKEWYSAQTDTTKALIWIGIIAIIGIILRWNVIIDGITRGFNFYSGE